MSMRPAITTRTGSKSHCTTPQETSHGSRACLFRCTGTGGASGVRCMDWTGGIDVAAIEMERPALPEETLFQPFGPSNLLESHDAVEAGSPILVVGFRLGFQDPGSGRRAVHECPGTLCLTSRSSLRCAERPPEVCSDDPPLTPIGEYCIGYPRRISPSVPPKPVWASLGNTSGTRGYFTQFWRERIRHLSSTEAAKRIYKAAAHISLGLLLTLTLLPTTSFSKDDTRVKVPENAHAEPYGRRWECDRGYHAEEGESCTRFTVPPHAHLDITGTSWNCNRGYRRMGDQCKEVEVPPNAFLHPDGDRWKCERGYREVDGSSCEKLELPANAYLEASGNHWSCERGFREMSHRCVRVVVPENGYLRRSGAEWDCSRGFSKQGDECVEIQLPSNAYLGEYGSSWSCERGFSKLGQACVQLEVPENAHIEPSGNAWACNSGFRRDGNACRERRAH